LGDLDEALSQGKGEEAHLFNDDSSKAVADEDNWTAACTIILAFVTKLDQEIASVVPDTCNRGVADNARIVPKREDPRPWQFVKQMIIQPCRLVIF
jgi:hypothetical protein